MEGTAAAAVKFGVRRGRRDGDGGLGGMRAIASANTWLREFVRTPSFNSFCLHCPGVCLRIVVQGPPPSSAKLTGVDDRELPSKHTSLPSCTRITVPTGDQLNQLPIMTAENKLNNEPFYLRY